MPSPQAAASRPLPPPPVGQGPLSVSVISHGHGALVQALVRDLAAQCAADVSHLILTLNQPEPALQRFVAETVWPFKLTLLVNAAAQSFGHNHNRAFGLTQTALFCVLNPDIRLPSNPFPALRAALAPERVACAYPVQCNERGLPQDFERKLPTPLSLWRRIVSRQRRSDGADWVNGAFMLFKADAYRQLRGFDERYRLYCEDVDICIRLQLEGWQMQIGAVSVVHLAQRATRRQARHLWWHVQSMFKLWCSRSYWSYLRQRHHQPQRQSP